MTDLNRWDPPIAGNSARGAPRRLRSKPITRRAARPAGEAAKSPLKAIAAHKRANYGPPAFRRPSALRRIGASPSGKAADFDSAIRRFESSRPSHAVPEFGDFAMTGAEARNLRAFADAEIGDRLEWVS